MKAMKINTQNQLATIHSIVFSFRFVVALRHRAGDVDDVQFVFPDHAAQVNVDEVQPRRRTPMTQQARLMCARVSGFFRRGLS